MQQYDSYVLHSNAKGIAGMFTADGELQSLGGLSIKGKDSVEKFLSQFDGIKVQEQKALPILFAGLVILLLNMENITSVR
jgi:hypothetical protein